MAVHAQFRGGRRRNVSRDTFREGQELLAVVEVELPQVFQVSDTFRERAVQHNASCRNGQESAEGSLSSDPDLHAGMKEQ